MTRLYRRLGYGLCITAVTLVMAGCASKSFNRAPVEDRMGRQGVTSPWNLAPSNQPPGFENAGKPGYYTVKPGETLLRISLETGQSTQDLARWNQLEDPNRIEVGQVIRVFAPTNEVVIKPIAKPQVVVTPSGSTPGSTTTASVTDPSGAPAYSVGDSKPVSVEEGINWIWPANGAVLEGFDDVKNKGVDIGEKIGDSIVAAADGRVVYVGAGLRGYGNLIILKHNNVFLTAYAHNQSLLVKEDQSVLKGQKIAEMGSSDADRVKLHFEVRRQGKPVDPAKYLPAR